MQKYKKNNEEVINKLIGQFKIIISDKQNISQAFKNYCNINHAPEAPMCNCNIIESNIKNTNTNYKIHAPAGMTSGNSNKWNKTIEHIRENENQHDIAHLLHFIRVVFREKMFKNKR